MIFSFKASKLIFYFLIIVCYTQNFMVIRENVIKGKPFHFYQTYTTEHGVLSGERPSYPENLFVPSSFLRINNWDFESVHVSFKMEELLSFWKLIPFMLNMTKSRWNTLMVSSWQTLIQSSHRSRTSMRSMTDIWSRLLSVSIL